MLLLFERHFLDCQSGGFSVALSSIIAATSTNGIDAFTNPLRPLKALGQSGHATGR
jgi:hypothetical protein